MSDPKTNGALVDGHVHVYACHDAPRLLDAAVAHLDRAASALAVDPSTPRLLALTETARDDFFRRARDGASIVGDAWSIAPTDESDSLIAARGDGRSLGLIAGRQIVTAEKIEVLALGRDADYQDGRPLEATLDDVRARDAVAVLPWGFGKWWGGRGRLVREAVERGRSGALLLGDNGGRPAVGVTPPLFGVARERGIAVLRGTDPLPLPAQAVRVGSYGCWVAGAFEAARPAAALRAALGAGAALRPFGRLRSVPSFVADQLAMRFGR